MENDTIRLKIMHPTEEITPAELPAHLTGSPTHVAGIQAALHRWTLADLERIYIRLALEWTEGKKAEASASMAATVARSANTP